jgi:hypothetical protein
MKKIIVALVIAFSFIGFQQASAQSGKHKVHYAKHKVFTTPNGKAYAYRGTNPRRTIVTVPAGKAIGYKKRNPNRARGKYK